MKREDKRREVGKFSCGVKDLDDWLSVLALDNQRRDLSRTFQLLDDADRVVGYHALTTGECARRRCPPGKGGGCRNSAAGWSSWAASPLPVSARGRGWVAFC